MSEQRQDGLGEALGICARAYEAKISQPIDQGSRVPREDGRDHSHEAFAHVIADRTHHPKVEQHDRAVSLHVDVAGVWVRVKEAVVEDHLGKDVNEVRRELGSVDAHGIQGADVGDADTLHVLHGQDLGRRGLPVDVRHGDVREVV